MKLADGRQIGLPWRWLTCRFERLAKATPSQRTRMQRIGIGDGIHWPDVDEDLSIAGLVRIAAEPEPPPRCATRTSRKSFRINHAAR